MAAPSPEKPEPTMAILMWAGSGRSAGADQGWSAASAFDEGGAEARSRSTEADFVMLGRLKEIGRPQPSVVVPSAKSGAAGWGSSARPLGSSQSSWRPSAVWSRMP